MGGVALLPEKLGGAQEQARAEFPPHHVGPLVDEHRQVAPALNPFAEEVADDGFRGGPDDVGLFQLFAARNGHHGQLRREAFDVFRLALQEALRDQQREVDVLVAAGLEPGIELALEHFPDRVAVGLDDHAALDDLGGLRHVALQDHVLVPRREIVASESNRRFSHVLEFFQVTKGVATLRKTRPTPAGGLRLREVQHRSARQILAVRARRPALVVADRDQNVADVGRVAGSQFETAVLVAEVA